MNSASHEFWRIDEYRTFPQIIHTPDDLLTYEGGKGFELVDGEFVERHVGSVSSLIGTLISAYLAMYCRDTKMGWAYGDGMGYRLPGLKNTVRMPDASVIRRERPRPTTLVVGYFSIAPDLAVEVVSPERFSR